MKYCAHCGKEFDTVESLCPICGELLRETGDTGEITALLLLLGLL